MSVVVVIGKTLADAKEYAAKCNMVDVALLSPQSFNSRFWGLRVERFYVTRDALRHPNICQVVLTVQRYMRKQTNGG